MKILFSSHLFWPSVGGVETVGKLLAEECAAKGHDVKVITESEGPKGEFEFEIIRRPGSKELRELVRWCDLVFHNNISLRTSWPLIFRARPWVITHHTWIANVQGKRGMAERAKLMAARFAKNISISSAIAEALPF